MRTLLPATMVLATLLSLTACSGTGTGSGTGTQSADGGSATNTPGPGANGEAEPAETSDDDPATTAGPIKIKNLSYIATDSQVEITFQIANTGSQAIERLQTISVGFSGAPLTFKAFSCSQMQPKPGETTSTITLTLSEYGSSSMLGSPCSSGAGASGHIKPWMGNLKLELRGLYDDASTWKASATASP